MDKEIAESARPTKERKKIPTAAAVAGVFAIFLAACSRDGANKVESPQPTIIPPSPTAPLPTETSEPQLVAQPTISPEVAATLGIPTAEPTSPTAPAVTEIPQEEISPTPMPPTPTPVPPTATPEIIPPTPTPEQDEQWGVGKDFQLYFDFLERVKIKVQKASGTEVELTDYTGQNLLIFQVDVPPTGDLNDLIKRLSEFEENNPNLPPFKIIIVDDWARALEQIQQSIEQSGFNGEVWEMVRTEVPTQASYDPREDSPIFAVDATGVLVDQGTPAYLIDPTLQGLRDMVEQFVR